MGVGCSTCAKHHFAFSGGCTPCSESGSLVLITALGTLGVVALGVCAWKLSATASVLDEVEGSRDNVETAAKAHGHVNNAVAFVGIGAFHLQLSSIKLNLPGVPFPATLRTIVKAIGAVISFDLGDVASFECSDFFAPSTLDSADNHVRVVRFKADMVNATFVVVVLALWLAGKLLGRRNHARNSMLATYTLMLVVIARAHVKFVDCTDGKFDLMPHTDCNLTEWGALREVLYGSIALCIYCVVVPVLILMALRRDTKGVFCFPCCSSRVLSRCFDSSAEAFDHDASYGWVTRKYAPSSRWFELAFIAYKIAATFACGELRPHSGQCLCVSDRYPFFLFVVLPLLALQACQMDP